MEPKAEKGTRQVKSADIEGSGKKQNVVFIFIYAVHCYLILLPGFLLRLPAFVHILEF